MINNQSKWLILALCLAGVAFLVFRWSMRSTESVPTGDSVWQINLSVTVDAGKQGHLLHMAIPQDSPHIRVLNQSFNHPGFTLRRMTPGKSLAREIIAKPINSGRLRFTSEYTIQISNTERWQQWFKKTSPLTAEDRLNYLNLPDDLLLDSSSLTAVISDISATAHNKDALLENIFNFVHQKIINDPALKYESTQKVLQQRRTNTLGQASLMVSLCRASNIPARLVTGVIVKEMLNLEEHYWVEVYNDEHWIPFDPSRGLAGEITPNYLRLKEGNEPLSHLTDGTPLNTIIDSVQLPTPAGLLGTGKKSLIDIFDLTRLPLSTQFLLSSLMLLPFGALVTTFFRSVIGLQTFGTFTPSLLALAIIHADWITVTVVITVVTLIGFGGRSLMPEKLTRVPRLTIVLTLVAIAMTLSVSLMDYFDLNPSASVVLLPVIVLTGIVDRAYGIVDEYGVTVALYRLVWTIVVTLICLLVFNIEALRHVTLVFPEIHFFTLAILLFITSHHWKKLTSLHQFEWLKEPRARHTVKKPEVHHTEE